MLRKSAVFVAALALLPALAVAQPREGDGTFTISGSGVNNQDFDAGTFALSGELGYFMTRELEVSLRQSVDYTNLNGTTWNFSTRVAGDWHFDFDAWQPFLGANIGYRYGQGVRDTGVAAPEAGVKYYVNSRTFIQGLVEYQFFFRRAEDLFRRGQFVYTVGVGFNY